MQQSIKNYRPPGDKIQIGPETEQIHDIEPNLKIHVETLKLLSFLIHSSFSSPKCQI